jgi:hypothetical protein
VQFPKSTISPVPCFLPVNYFKITRRSSTQNWEQVDLFCASDQVRVLLTDYSSNSSGASFVKATTVIFLGIFLFLLFFTIRINIVSIDPINSDDRLAALQVEAMALGKTHRLGQHNDITVLR